MKFICSLLLFHHVEVLKLLKTIVNHLNLLTCAFLYQSEFVKTWLWGFCLAPGTACLQASVVSKNWGSLPFWSAQVEISLTVGGWSRLWGNNDGVGRGLFWHNPYSKEQCYLLEALTGKYLHYPFAQVNSIRPLLIIMIMIITKLKGTSKSIQCVAWGGWILGTKDLLRLYSETIST